MSDVLCGYSLAMTSLRTDEPDLDPAVCQQARLARDPRFDGEFYLGVLTTGIYCRPVCPARLPSEQNVRYFRLAAQAAEAGFRPCLRCRPETAPGSPARAGSLTTTERALTLIRGGALNHGSKLEDLATRLGVGERYLRKLFQRDLGLSPHAVAGHQRLLLARQLIVESQLPLTAVAEAAGFGSLRRFNSAIKTAYGMPPSAMRRNSDSDAGRSSVTLQLRYRPPYNWPAVLAYLERHLVDEIEWIDAGHYVRRVAVGSDVGIVTIAHQESGHCLQLSVTSDGNVPDLMPLVANCRRMFDLDANPAVIEPELSKDPLLASLLESQRGIRSPGAWTPAESAVRAIVGQQVSIAAARRVCAQLAAACEPDESVRTFPTPGAIAALGDKYFAMPGRRRDTLRALHLAVGTAGEQMDLERLGALKGVGPWTTAVVSMRGMGDPDAFPDADLGLLKALGVKSNSAALKTRIASWRPWRSYAANLLWRSLES